MVLSLLLPLLSAEISPKSVTAHYRLNCWTAKGLRCAGFPEHSATRLSEGGQFYDAPVCATFFEQGTVTLHNSRLHAVPFVSLSN